MKVPTLPYIHLVLVGGGHSHVQVLRRFMMRPADGARLQISLVTREVHTPYSGMLPGHVAGLYSYDEMHIDLAKLCRAANVRLIVDEVQQIDLAGQHVKGKYHPPLSYDVLSINSGASPGFEGVELSGTVTPVKPIGKFLDAWRDIRADVSESIARADKRSLVVVGGGAGGVELAFAVSTAFAGSDRKLLELHLIEQDASILPGHNPLVKRWAERRLREAGISILNGFQVEKAGSKGIFNLQGTRIEAHHIMWTTGVSAPSFILDSGLDLDSRGFVSVNRFLQSTSHANVFASGDVADCVGQTRPKSGVYAVRAGPKLAENLLRFCDGRALTPYKAQSGALAIIGNYQGSAVASRGSFFAAGKPVFRFKQWIDHRFMTKFAPRPMTSEGSDAELADIRMRCAGCGSKLPARLLNRVLKRLDILDQDELLQGIGEDAALIKLNANALAISTDHFPQMISDSYRFGRISAHHGMSDLFAMGAIPRYALVNLSVQLMAPALMEEEAYLMLKGANDVFKEEGVSLAGGHSTESDTTQLGCTLFGELTEKPLSKSGFISGDHLILTKPLGIGVILAGEMRLETRGRWLQSALRVMDQSNGPAVKLLREFGCVSCTDVTGFGLLGHLSEMLRASKLAAEVWLEEVPMLDGATELVEFGIESSLQSGNAAVLEDVELVGLHQSNAKLALLMDPQTSGGLLVGVSERNTAPLLDALREAGYSQAAVVGRVVKNGLPELMRVLEANAV